jgi:hypothetical protein
MELDAPDTTAELLDHPKYRKVRATNKGCRTACKKIVAENIRLKITSKWMKQRDVPA